MALSLQFTELNDTIDADSIFIGAGSTLNDGLKGVLPSELAPSEPALTKEGKAMLSIFSMLNQYLAANPALGLSITLADTNVGTGIDQEAYTTTFSLVLDADTGTSVPIPVPTIGANAGAGDVIFNTVFPSAQKLSAAATAPDAGVAIPTSVLENLSTLTHATIDLAADSRELIAAMMLYTALNIEIRDPDSATGVVASTPPIYTGGALPANAFDGTNPTTGLDSAKQALYGVTDRTVTTTFETLKNYEAQTFDLRVVTT